MSSLGKGRGMGLGEVAQMVKELATESDNLSWILGIHEVEEEN